MKKIIIVILLLQTSILFSQTPKLSGTIEISINNGTIDADLTLSDIPEVENYEILINAGLNLDFIRTDIHSYSYAFEKKYDIKISEESFLYSLENKDGKFLPNQLRFKYGGKFPIKSDTTYMTRKGDWKGNIAFNGQNLRMDGYQTNWYPVIKDITNDKSFELVKYDIEVICNDCKSLYINNNEPLKAKRNRFKSNIPTEALLFVGNYEFYNIDGTYFLNPDISESEMKEFTKTVDKFKGFYSEKTGTSFDGNFNFIQTQPTSKKNAFLFVAYPSIVNIGRGYYGLEFFVSEQNSYAKPLIAHELAHYYFGSGYKKFNSAIAGAIQEGFAEYMSFKATEEVFGKSIYQEKSNDLLKRFDNEKTFLPISKIKNKADYGNYYFYVYNYFPTILLAIESEIGEKKMWKWISYLLTTNTSYTDYSFLQDTLEKAIGNKKISNRIVNEYFLAENTINNAIDEIRK